MMRITVLKSSLFMALLTLFVMSCGNDDEGMTPPANDTVASFQFAISETNFLEVSFSNFSQNATSYAWDFGDGNSSTEASPTHTYAAPGTYSVTLEATGANGSASKSETINITDPDATLTMLAGTTSKTWYLQREGIALGIGPNVNDNGWWSFGGATPLGDRPCILDDAYTFHRDGTWEFNSGGTIFVDADANGGWLGQPEGCHDETEAGLFTSTAGDDVSAFANGGDYSFVFDQATNQLTLNGLGAYIGLPTKTAAGDNIIPIATKTYQVFNFADGDVADSLHIALAGDGFAWNFYLVSYDNPADLPDIPATVPTADFSSSVEGFVATFTNASKNATSYSWDFGDGNSSTDENPVHTYAAEGEYTVTLTASDDMGGSDMKSNTVVISVATFTAAKLSNANGKVWKLDGDGSYVVGDSKGSTIWWDGAGIIDRACQLDDEFIFTDGGTFEYVSQDQVWAESYMLGPNGCMNVADLMSPFDVFQSATHSFTATDTHITVTGTGAFIGFSKPFNGGELNNDGTGTPAGEITYEVFDYSNVDGVERLTVVIDFSDGETGTAYWTIRLISQ